MISVEYELKRSVMSERGKFIVFEGLDGCGKSTQLTLLCEKMQAAGENVVCHTTFEPTDGPIGRLIRSALRKEVSFSQETMAMLYAADRREHVEKEVIPLLDQGVNVLCDRYYFSNFVYQADAVSLEKLMLFNGYAMENLKPDITVFMDASPDACVKKIAESRESADLYETLEKLTQVKEAYHKVFDMLCSTHRIITIEPMETKYMTADRLWELLKDEFTGK